MFLMHYNFAVVFNAPLSLTCKSARKFSSLNNNNNNNNNNNKIWTIYFYGMALVYKTNYSSVNLST